MRASLSISCSGLAPQCSRSGQLPAPRSLAGRPPSSYKLSCAAWINGINHVSKWCTLTSLPSTVACAFGQKSPWKGVQRGTYQRDDPFSTDYDSRDRGSGGRKRNERTFERGERGGRGEGDRRDFERPAKIFKGGDDNRRDRWSDRDGGNNGRDRGDNGRDRWSNGRDGGNHGRDRGDNGRDGGNNDGDREFTRNERGGQYSQPQAPAPQKPHQTPVYLTNVPIVRSGEGDKGTFYSSNSFKRMGASEDVIKAVQSLGIKRPSHIQAQSFPTLLAPGGPSHVVLADAAGSGKTLAYLLPLLQQLREREAANGGPVTRPHQPSIVVICPTAELAQQVFRVVRGLSKGGLKARSAAFTSTSSGLYRTQKQLLKEGVDIVICTPLRLTALMEYGDLSLVNCQALVLDEVDILLGDTSAFSEQVTPLLEAGGPKMRLVMVTATLPDHTYDQLLRMFPRMAATFGPGLHKVATGLVEELVDCSGGEEVNLESGTQRKLAALLSVLQQHKAKRALVFCNKIDTCRRVENFLQRQDRKSEQYKVLAYHAAINKAAQQAALDTFLAEDADDAVPMYLVCTDRTSRGLDSILCEHVVLFDFPRDPSEYVRRVGRTARGAGGVGTVSVLVLGKQVKLAKSILDRNRKGGTVHKIPLTYMPWTTPPQQSRNGPTPGQPIAMPISSPSAADYDDYAAEIGRALGVEALPAGSAKDEPERRQDRASSRDDSGSEGLEDGCVGVSGVKHRIDEDKSDKIDKQKGESQVESHELEEDDMEDDGEFDEFEDGEEFEDEFEEDEEEEVFGGGEDGLEPGRDFVVVKAPSKPPKK